MHDETPSAKPRMPLWGRVALFIICYSVAHLVTQVAYGVLLLQLAPPPAGAPAEQPPAGFSLGWYSTIALVSMAVSWGFWTRVDRRRWSDLRLRLADGAAWRRGGVWALLLIVPTTAIHVALGHVHFEGWAFDGPAEGLMRSCLHLGSALAVAVSLELPFRGYLLGTLGERLSPGKAVLISSVLSWVAHSHQPEQRDLLNALTTVTTGAAFAYLRLASGSLALPTAAATVLYLDFFLFSSDPWLEPLVKLRYGAPSVWLSGSDYYAGLLDVWLVFFWLVGIYVWVYLPSAARLEPAESSGAVEVVTSSLSREPSPGVARIRPRRKPADEGATEDGGAPTAPGEGEKRQR